MTETIGHILSRSHASGYTEFLLMKHDYCVDQTPSRNFEWVSKAKHSSIFKDKKSLDLILNTPWFFEEHNCQYVPISVQIDY